MAISLTKLRISSAPAASSTTAHANCAATRTEKMRRCRTPAVALRPPSFSAPEESWRDDSNAGSRPQTSAAAIDAAAVKARTRPSSPISCDRGSPSLSDVSSARVSHHASASPEAPPATASTPVSTRISRMTRPRPAPRAVRIAISRPRAAARVSIRQAMSAQAISSSTPTAASNTTSSRRILPTTSSCIGVTVAVSGGNPLSRRRGG